MCDHRLHVAVEDGSGQLLTGTHGSSPLKRISKSLVGCAPPQMMPTTRYMMRPSAIHFSTRIGIAAVSIVAGAKSLARAGTPAWCVRAANSRICDVAGASALTSDICSTHLIHTEPYHPGTTSRIGAP